MWTDIIAVMFPVFAWQPREDAAAALIGAHVVLKARRRLDIQELLELVPCPASNNTASTSVLRFAQHLEEGLGKQLVQLPEHAQLAPQGGAFGM